MEKKYTHTAGEWKTSHLGDDQILVMSSHKDILICRLNQSMAASNKYEIRMEAEANAKLIASAPELLEALKALLDFVKNPPSEKLVWPVKMAEIAINKATL